jgi:hypothetical protein
MNLKLLALALVAMTGIALTSMSATSAYAQPMPNDNDGCTLRCDHGGKDDGGRGDRGRDDDDDDDDDRCIGIRCDDDNPNCIPGAAPCEPNGGNPKYGYLECAFDVGRLAKVSARQINRVGDEDRVLIVKVCDSKNLMKQQKGVENIRFAIRRNDRMDEVLNDHGFDAGDVVGVMISKQDAVLYVYAAS